MARKKQPPKKRDKRIKLSDEQLMDLVKEDITASEHYFDTRVKPYVVLRYNLLHSNSDYYKGLFPKLTDKLCFSSSDIKDAVEWMMPSVIEAFFGPDRIVGIKGRTPDDNPEPLENTIKYQVQTQNEGYEILSQWLRDGLEAGTGSLFAEWLRREEEQVLEKAIPEQLFGSLPDEALDKIEDAADNGDGTITVKYKAMVRAKDQPRLRNLMPGMHIWLPLKDEDGRYVFEAAREWVLLDDLKKQQRDGLLRNVDEIDVKAAQAEAGDDGTNSLKDIRDAITNYEGEDGAEEIENSMWGVNDRHDQDGRNSVLRYICFAKYDVDGDGLLERVKITYCGNQVLDAEVYDTYSNNHIITVAMFANSYQRWKQGVADFLQGVQDLKSAFIMQIAANVAYNNDRPVMVDDKQVNAIADLEAGKKAVRLKRSRGDNLDELLKPLPENPISEYAWAMIEWLTMAGENKVGVSRQTQGLDGDTLAKMTAFGVGKVMGAQQQRLRLLVRNASSGVVNLYEHLIELNQANVDQALVVRVTGEHYEYQPDDLKGHFDTEVLSNIGLNSKEATIGSLMVMFSQILPALLQQGIATPVGLYNTAKELGKHMGFQAPEDLIGLNENEVRTKLQQQDAMGQILTNMPQLLGGIMQQSGIQPETAANVTRNVMGAIQQAMTPQGAPPNA